MWRRSSSTSLWDFPREDCTMKTNAALVNLFGWLVWLKAFFLVGAKSAIYSQNSQMLLTKSGDSVSISTFKCIDNYFTIFSKSNLVNELINLTLLYHKASTVTQPAAIGDLTWLHVFSPTITVRIIYLWTAPIKQQLLVIQLLELRFSTTH